MIVPDYDDDDDFYAAQAMMANEYDENWEPETLNSWIYSTGTLFDLDEE
jgi:hypothetical protein